MKKMIVCLITLIIILSLSACSSGTQKISFQGINMEIPASWKADKHSISEDYAIYEALNKKGHDYRLLLNDTFELLDKSEDLEDAGDFFKEVTEDNASYSDVGEPVAEKLADKYDMHIIDCTYHAHNPLEDDGESDYPCKLIRIYMGDHDVEIEFITANGDFEAFDEAIANASVTN
ncbi:hypothetical protein PG2019B_1598 [Bifidobacterium pseudolongum subsp. globosum]|nr:hypothetical protein PG2019B_1598 [Bifidobacterium pseudolongum subsp. globosum]